MSEIKGTKRDALPLPGQLILRILSLRPGRKIVKVEKVNYQTTKEGGFLFRTMNAASIGFVAIKQVEDQEVWLAMPNQNAGLFCFCRNEIPQDTIAFEVIGVSKNRTAVFVTPVRGKFSELLKYYDFGLNKAEIAFIE